MTLQEVEAALTALAGAPGLWVNTKLALAGNVAVDGEEVVVTDVRGREFVWRPRRSARCGPQARTIAARPTERWRQRVNPE